MKSPPLACSVRRHSSPLESEEQTRTLPTDRGLAETRPGTATATSSAAVLATARLVPRDARYQVERHLGIGSMGVVEACRDRWLGRLVACKTMQPKHRSEQTLQRRFEREARIQGQLEHPAIVPVYDVEPGPHGLKHFTMRRVQGNSLREIIHTLRHGDALHDRWSSFPLRRRLSVFARVCQAIAFAHAQGVVHRDIKPANVMVGEHGEVYVLDWGVARRLDADGDDDDDGDDEKDGPSSVTLPSSLEGDTQLGDLIGTLGYMPPEQARGERVGPSADVYSLGATLFELLTLRRLDPPRDDNDNSIAAANDDPFGEEEGDRISGVVQTAQLPPELEDLCVRATKLDPNARPTAREMAEALESFLDGQHDCARRMQLAAEHTERARSLVDGGEASSSSDGDARNDARERALKEISHALALDPNHPPAVALLRTLMSRQEEHDGEEPREHPDAQAALIAAGWRLRRVAGKIGMGAIAFCGVVATLLVAFGVRSWPPIIAMLVMLVATGAISIANRRRMNLGLAWLGFIGSYVAAGLQALCLGPLLVTPGLLGFLAVAFSLGIRPRSWRKAHEPNTRFMREAAFIAPLLTFAILIVLELVGVLAPSMAFVNGTIVIMPRALEFPPLLTPIYLVVINLVFIVSPALLATKIQDNMFDEHRESLNAAARLRGLVPAEARDATPIAKSGSPEEEDEAKTWSLGAGDRRRQAR